MNRRILLACGVLVAASLSLNVFLITRHPSIFADSPPTPATIKNGDVNGDGSIDLTDVIGLLTYLFIDGPQPVAIVPVVLPAEEPRFDHTCQTIRDRQTGLEWTNRPVNTGDRVNVPPGLLPDADSYYTIYYLTDYGLESEYSDSYIGIGGYSDWRLPTRAELDTLVGTGNLCATADECLWTSEVVFDKDRPDWPDGASQAYDECMHNSSSEPFICCPNTYVSQRYVWCGGTGYYSLNSLSEEFWSCYNDADHAERHRFVAVRKWK